MNGSSPRSLSRSARIGVRADGWFKLALSLAYASFIAPLSAWLQVPSWLTAVAVAAIASSGVAELARPRALARRHVLLLMGYDAVWVIASLVSWLMVLAGSTAAGQVWLATQAIASVILAILFILGPSPRIRPRQQRIRK